MSYIYQAEFDGGQLLEIKRSDIEMLDFEVIAKDVYHVLEGNRSHNIQVLQADHVNKQFRLMVNGHKIDVRLRDAVEVQVHDMGLDEVEESHAKEMMAPMPGLVLSVHVKSGDAVEKGDQLLILEAMKMENVLAASTTGTVAEVLVEPGQAVDKSQILITFD